MLSTIWGDERKHVTSVTRNPYIFTIEKYKFNPIRCFVDSQIRMSDSFWEASVKILSKLPLSDVSGGIQVLESTTTTLSPLLFKIKWTLKHQSSNFTYVNIFPIYAQR